MTTHRPGGVGRDAGPYVIALAALVALVILAVLLAA